MTVLRAGEANVAAIIDMDDFIKMLTRMKEKGYSKVIHTTQLDELSVSDNDQYYNIGFALTTNTFKQKEPDLDIVVKDGHHACMLIMVKDEEVKNLNLGSE
jgi:hypothetical protein